MLPLLGTSAYFKLVQFVQEIEDKTKLSSIVPRNESMAAQLVLSVDQKSFLSPTEKNSYLRQKGLQSVNPVLLPAGSNNGPRHQLPLPSNMQKRNYIQPNGQIRPLPPAPGRSLLGNGRQPQPIRLTPQQLKLNPQQVRSAQGGPPKPSGPTKIKASKELPAGSRISSVPPGTKITTNNVAYSTHGRTGLNPGVYKVTKPGQVESVLVVKADADVVVPKKDDVVEVDNIAEGENDPLSEVDPLSGMLPLPPGMEALGAPSAEEELAGQSNMDDDDDEEPPDMSAFLECNVNENDDKQDGGEEQPKGELGDIEEYDTDIDHDDLDESDFGDDAEDGNKKNNAKEKEQAKKRKRSPSAEENGEDESAAKKTKDDEEEESNPLDVNDENQEESNPLEDEGKEESNPLEDENKEESNPNEDDFRDPLDGEDQDESNPLGEEGQEESNPLEDEGQDETNPNEDDFNEEESNPLEDEGTQDSHAEENEAKED